MYLARTIREGFFVSLTFRGSAGTDWVQMMLDDAIVGLIDSLSGFVKIQFSSLDQISQNASCRLFPRSINDPVQGRVLGSCLRSIGSIVGRTAELGEKSIICR